MKDKDSFQNYNICRIYLQNTLKQHKLEAWLIFYSRYVCPLLEERRQEMWFGKHYNNKLFKFKYEITIKIEDYFNIQFKKKYLN